jgi:hypothetical protein
MAPENKLKFDDRAPLASSSRRVAPNPILEREFERFKAFEAGRDKADQRHYERLVVKSNEQLVRTVDAKLTAMERRRRARFS